MEWKEGHITNQMSHDGISAEIPGPIPPSLEVLYSSCRKIYPDQPNPLQVTALLKYWLGGPDPLDYISMYDNPGDKQLGIPPHWHYVGFGCSDLHGDGRVHEQTGEENPSGFGFELTMRLKKESEEKSPPTWPAAIMQALAKYVFQSESTLCVGDHVSWHCPLDNSESRVQHMLMGEDPQLGKVITPNGPVQFVQIVGVTTEELRAAQHWNGLGVIDIIKRFPGAGGFWMITDMRRGESIYEIEPSVSEEIENGIETEGSNLSGVSAKISWMECEQENTIPISSQLPISDTVLDAELTTRVSQTESEEIRSALQKGLLGANKSTTDKGVNDVRTSSINDATEKDPSTTESAELLITHKYDSLHLTINLESGALLPLALRGRLKHGRHFTFKSTLDAGAVTLVSPGVAGSFVEPGCPYASRGQWLQILILDEFLPTLVNDLADLADPDEVSVPISFTWPDQKLSITVIGEDA